jgi:hypothetical protein
LERTLKDENKLAQSQHPNPNSLEMVEILNQVQFKIVLDFFSHGQIT